MPTERAGEGSLRIRAGCSCGGGLDVTSNPPQAARDIAEVFRDVHQGEGHRALRPGERRPRRKDNDV